MSQTKEYKIEVIDFFGKHFVEAVVVKFLGLHVDSKLIWNSQIERLFRIT